MLLLSHLENERKGKFEYEYCYELKYSGKSLKVETHLETTSY